MAKVSTSLLITISFIILVIITALVSVLIPVFMPDGSEQYIGVKKQVAEDAVSFSNEVSTSSPLPLFMKVHVDNITEPQKKDNITCNYSFQSNNSSPQVFEITVSHRWFFGVSTKTDTLHACSTHQ